MQPSLHSGAIIKKDGKSLYGKAMIKAKRIIKRILNK